MFNRILIPLDGSILAERAIPHAEEFARIFGATIVLLRVLEVMSPQEDSDPINPLSWQIRKAEADVYLREVSARIRAHLSQALIDGGGEGANDDRVEYAVREGRIAENIIDFAHHENIDLLIISSHGGGGLSRWNFSSTIQKVIELVYLPVLVVRSYQQQGEIDDRIRYRSILLPIDSSRRAEYALSAGIMLAQGESMLSASIADGLTETELPALRYDTPAGGSGGAKIILTAVIIPPEIPIPAPYPVEINKLAEQFVQLSREAVHAYLSEMQLRLPVDCEIRVVESNHVPSAIQELADQENADLILMCAHGYTGQLSYPYGSVARNTLEHGTKTTLVIQDLPRSQVRPTAAAESAEKSGRR